MTDATMHHISDQDLIRMLRAKNPDAAAELFGRYHDWSEHLTRTHHPRAVTADVSITALTRTILHLRSTTGPTERFSSYLRTFITQPISAR
ncbi:hypothetical protein [Leifsonia sp. fls2-241-R2A-40a]|uniref:hypothetical protein n=1 Tax=Leifsonia sp. fls2-241-R2A-40a TaxID=3040290 RepID=UPI00254DB76D|nr:hypothetical protein [Leifsonia sp. fls2-241-R2A-40a]